VRNIADSVVPGNLARSAPPGHQQIIPARPAPSSLLVELARLNGDMASFALRIMDGSASVAEQHYAQQLMAVR
jgi:hypothetical protein